MNHDKANWRKKYVEVGYPVAVYPFPWRREPFVGIVEKITKNQYGRVSYVVDGFNVFAEELFPAKGEKKLKVPYFKPTRKR